MADPWDIVSKIGQFIPGLGAPVAAAGAIGEAATGHSERAKQAALGMIPGLGDYIALNPSNPSVPKAIQGAANTGGIGRPSPGAQPKQAADTKAPDPTKDQSLADWLIGQMGNLNWGQLNQPSSQQTSALASAIKGLDPADAQRVINALPNNAKISGGVQQALGLGQQSGGTANDALSMGLMMFFQNYMAPLMKQINDSNQQLIGQYGSAMQGAQNVPMPAGMKQFFANESAGTAQNLALQNQAGAAQAAGTIPFQYLLQGLGQETAAQQLAAQALPHAAALQELNLGQGSALASLYPQGSILNLLFGNATPSSIPNAQGVAPLIP